MSFTVGAQTAQGLGTLLGQMFGGGMGQKDYAQGQLVGTQIRERKAKAALDEQQYKSIADAITAGLAGNWQAANVNSLYGGHGRTSFDVTNQGAVFNKNTGEVDIGNGIAQAFLKLKGAEAANQSLQGDYYRSKAETERGLLNERERVEVAKALFDEARARDVNSLIKPKQEAMLAQAFARMAQGRQYDAAAGLNNARAGEVNSLIAPKQEAMLAQAFARMAQGRQYDAAAGLNNARAGEVQALMPLEQQLKAAQTANQMGLATRNHQLAASTPAVQQSIVDRNKAQAEKLRQADQSKLLENPVVANVLAQIQDLDSQLSQEEPNKPLIWGRGNYEAGTEKQRLLQQRMSLQDQLNTLLSAGGAAPSSGAPFPDGALIRGKDGRQYRVVNGQPVAVGG